MSDYNLTAKDWPHAPVHRLDTDGFYIVTAGTLYKAHLFNITGAPRRGLNEQPRRRP